MLAIIIKIKQRTMNFKVLLICMFAFMLAHLTQALASSQKDIESFLSEKLNIAIDGQTKLVTRTDSKTNKYHINVERGNKSYKVTLVEGGGGQL